MQYVVFVQLLWLNLARGLTRLRCATPWCDPHLSKQWPHRLVVRTPGFHPGNRGSIPLEATIRLAPLALAHGLRSFGAPTKYTRSHRPIRFVYNEEFSTLVEARRREAQVKTWSKIKKERLIEGKHPTKNNKM